MNVRTYSDEDVAFFRKPYVAEVKEPEPKKPLKERIGDALVQGIALLVLAYIRVLVPLAGVVTGTLVSLNAVHITNLSVFWLYAPGLAIIGIALPVVIPVAIISVIMLVVLAGADRLR